MGVARPRRGPAGKVFRPRAQNPAVASGPEGGGEAGASGEPPGRKNEKFWEINEIEAVQQ